MFDFIVAVAEVVEDSAAGFSGTGQTSSAGEGAAMTSASFSFCSSASRARRKVAIDIAVLQWKSLTSILDASEAKMLDG